MSDMSVHYSSAKQDWGTPRAFFQVQAEKYGPFALDVCALAHNAKCERYFTPEDDGLAQPWFGVAWCNPPFNASRAWLEKALAELEAGNITRAVFLLPARPDTKLWHELIFPNAAEIVWHEGRLRFEGAKNSAPFPSVVVVFDREKVDPLAAKDREIAELRKALKSLRNAAYSTAKCARNVFWDEADKRQTPGTSTEIQDNQ